MKKNERNNPKNAPVSANETMTNYSSGLDLGDANRLLEKLEILVFNCIHDNGDVNEIDVALRMMEDYVERLNIKEITYTYHRVCQNLNDGKMTDLFLEIFADQIAQAKKSNDVFIYGDNAETTPTVTN